MNINESNKILPLLNKRICSELHSKQTLSYGLLGGDFGGLLFLFMLNKQTGAHQDECEEYLDRLFGSIRHTRPFPTYCNGLAGTGIGLMLLAENDLIELDNGSLDSIDSYLYCEMRRFMAVGNFDLLHGATGIALYFVKRIRQAGPTSKDALQEYITRLSQYLEWHTDQHDKEYAWCRMPDAFSTEEHNISMSHGIAGIANVLSQMYLSQMLDNDINCMTLRMIKALTNTIISQRMNYRQKGCFFPSYHLETGNDYASRMAWCYGDVGVLASLEMVAEATVDSALQSTVARMAATETIRRRFNQTFVRDACVCHGAAGIYAYFAHAASQFSDISEVLDDSALYWERYILGLDFDKLCYDAVAKKYRPQYCILNGYAGIGLSLLDDKTVLNKLLLYEKI